MQATTARPLPGGMGRSPLANEVANSALLLSSSSVTDTGSSLRRGGTGGAGADRPGSGVRRLPRLPGPGTAAGDHAPVVEGAVADQQEGDHTGISVPGRGGPRNRPVRPGRPRPGSRPPARPAPSRSAGGRGGSGRAASGRGPRSGPARPPTTGRGG